MRLMMPRLSYDLGLKIRLVLVDSVVREAGLNVVGTSIV